MMFFEFGTGLVLIWVLNWMWMFWQIVKFTPNWRESDVDSDQLVENFITNAPPNLIEFFTKVAQTNPVFGVTGVVLLLMSMIIA